jgi:hypothetical protein
LRFHKKTLKYFHHRDHRENKIQREKTKKNDFIYLVFIRKFSLPLRERVGVRGMKIESLEILRLNHPHPHPPPSRGRGKTGFPDGDYLRILNEKVVCLFALCASVVNVF